MRVMVIVKANKDSENGVLPSEAELSVMGRFNDELVKAGIMLAGDGLKSSKSGVRIRFPQKDVIDGPFAETKELIAGYWIWQVKTLEEAIQWARRAPCFETQGELELRPLYEITDFDISDVAREHFETRRAQLAQKS